MRMQGNIEDKHNDFYLTLLVVVLLIVGLAAMPYFLFFEYKEASQLLNNWYLGVFRGIGICMVIASGGYLIVSRLRGKSYS